MFNAVETWNAEGVFLFVPRVECWLNLTEEVMRDKKTGLLGFKSRRFDYSQIGSSVRHVHVHPAIVELVSLKRLRQMATRQMVGVSEELGIRFMKMVQVNMVLPFEGDMMDFANDLQYQNGRVEMEREIISPYVNGLLTHVKLEFERK